MTIAKISPKNLNKTYIGSIQPNENWSHFLKIADHLGHLKRLDYQRNYGSEQRLENKQKIKERVEFLRSHDINDVLSKTIINDNDAQFALAKRTQKANRAEWYKDVKYATSRPKNVKAQKRAQIAQKNIDKGWFPTITHGGNKLWREAQFDSEKMVEFKNRRLWFGSIGRSDDTSKRLSNQVIRVNEDAQIWINVPAFYLQESGLTDKWLNIGNLRMKHGFSEILYHRQSGKSVTFHVQFLRGKWCLRATLQKESVLKNPDSRRVLGMDVNSGHVDFIILDEFGNPASRPKTLNFNNKRDIRGVIQRMLKWASDRGVTTVFAEDLAGLQRRVSRKGAGALNRTTSSIPSGAIKRELIDQCGDRGLVLEFVDPAYTSKNTVFWADVVRGDTHQKASYLIGRVGLGYSISPRSNVVLLDSEGDSGRSLVSVRTGEILAQLGKNGNLLSDSVLK